MDEVLTDREENIRQRQYYQNNKSKIKKKMTYRYMTENRKMMLNTLLDALRLTKVGKQLNETDYEFLKIEIVAKMREIQ